MSVNIDREQMRRQLESWLARKYDGVSELSLSELRFPQGTGNSAETTFADLNYKIADEKRVETLVFRRQLEGFDLFLNATLDLPYNMMQALGRHPAVPVPKVVGIETDRSLIGSPFLVMETVAGRVVDQVPNYNTAGWVKDLALADRCSVWLNAISVLAELHNLNWQDGFTFLDDPARGASGLDQYLNYVRDWYLWAKAERELPVADAALAYLYDNKPANSDVSVLWGDPTPANILFNPDRSVAAILDFEMAALGPGEIDLAHWLTMEDFYSSLAGVPRLEGLPSRDETIAFYEKLRGRKIVNMNFYNMLAHFRINTVGIRFADRLVNQGKMPAGTDVLTHNPSTMLMAKLLGLDIPQVGEGFALLLRRVAGAT